jgi:hypothetical protein
MADQVNQSIHDFERINMIMEIENRFSNPPGVSDSQSHIFLTICPYKDNSLVVKHLKIQ